ncbi:MBG domain-containing protein, partial [Marinoscillum sp. 108]|uniref:MBG domain-containing protein n=1 Tax=Marinoscillum sp. 108 TaxID=2653151 RepID=UPI0013578707
LDVQQTLTIEKASQAITFEALADKTYGDAAFDLTATGGASGHEVTFTSSDETVASISGSTVTIVGAGTATITASQAGNDNYSAALDVQQTLTIEKASQAITFEALADKTYGDAAFDLTATGGASGHAVTFTSSDETVASISGSTVTIVGAGTATITANQAGNDNYSAALDVQQTLTIEKASQAITFEALADKTYGDAAFDLTATGGSSGHVVTFTSSDETVASVSGSTVTIVGAGTATITASQAGNDNYSAALDVQQTLTIEKASQAITFEALADKTYGDAAFDLTATGGASGHEVTFTSSDETVASISGSTVTIVGAGTATITASQAGNDNYSAALDVQQTLTIEKASQAITFETLTDKTYGDADFDLTATGGASGHEVTFTSSDETVASISGSTVTIVGAGTATITASQAGNENYSAALDVTQSLTIEKASQAITFEALADKTYGDAPFDLTATGGGSGYAVTFTSSDETVASVSGSTVTIVGAGTATITASQSGNDNYSAALDVSQSLMIGQASLMVSAGDEFRVYGEVNPGFTIGYQGFIGDDSEADLETIPTASTLATQTSDVGTYAITVSGGVAQNYAFTYTDGTLTINKAQATVTLENLTQPADGTAKSPTVTTNPAALAYSMTFDGSSTLPTQAGTYVVEVTLLETNYEGSVTGNFVLTKAVALGALPLVNEVKVYPNPAAERLTVSGDDGLLVKIYDISGVLLLEDEINQTIAIDRLRAGVYLLQVSDANGRVVSHQRVVKY